jgi:N4-gp56 family major capsid protein
MPGQLWGINARGGYMFSEELSDYLRMAVQPRAVFRQFCQVPEDAVDKGLHRGGTYTWGVYSNIQTRGRRISETDPAPESNFTITQASTTVYEIMNTVPYTGMLEMLAKHDLISIIDKTLRLDAAKAFDIEAFLQFDDCLTRYAPAGGTSTTSLTKTTNASTATTNNVELGTGHIKAISDDMRESNIPPFVGNDYICVTHPTTLRPFKNEMESINQYTKPGIDMVYSGEVGRYEGFRFVEQTNIPKGGAIDSATFDPYTDTSDPWNNAKSSWAFFFGDDTVIEPIVVPEEMRAKLPGDYGRDKGMGYYYLGAFAGVHETDATQSRIAKWDSAA